jgi:rare lipoprotein A (peptidoglycan hydrolase)
MQTMIGGASYYDLPGNLMANGQKFDATAMNAAMLQTKLGTVVTVSPGLKPNKSNKGHSH